MMKPRATLAACRALAGRVDVLHIQTPFVAHRIGLKAARATARADGRDLPHVLRGIPAPLRAAAAARRSHARSRARSRGGNATPSTPSSRRRAQLADVLAGYGVTRPIHAIPTGLNLDEFAGGDGAAFRARTASRPIARSCCSSAESRTRRTSASCCEVLAEVRRRVPNVLFVVAGEGPALPALRRAAAADGLAGQHAVRRLSRSARRAARLLPRRRRLRVRVAHRDAGARAAREPRAGRAGGLDRRARHEGGARERGGCARRRARTWRNSRPPWRAC